MISGRQAIHHSGENLTVYPEASATARRAIECVVWAKLAERWDRATPAPAFWMHQLGGVTKAPRLNKEEFKDKGKELLASVK